MDEGSNRTKIIVAVIPAIAIIIVAIIGKISFTNKPNNNYQHIYIVSGVVVDDKTNNSVPQAEITIIGRPEKDITDNSGNFKIELKDSLPTVRLRTTKDHYLPIDRTYSVPNQEVVILLKKI